MEKVPSEALVRTENVRQSDFIKDLQERLGPDVDIKVEKKGEYTYFIISTNAFDYDAGRHSEKAMALINAVREARPDIDMSASYGFNMSELKPPYKGFRMTFSLPNFSEESRELPNAKKEIGGH